jgi:ketosteroid isomerase-like protein
VTDVRIHLAGDMSTDHSHHVALTTDPARHPEVFARAFNTGDVAVLDQVYEPGAVFVPRPGEPVTGADRRAANQAFLALGLPISVTPRHTYVRDDIALLIVDFVIEGTGPDGVPVHIEGTATDVARRGPDGFWRYVIDNPFGVADIGPA